MKNTLLIWFFGVLWALAAPLAVVAQGSATLKGTVKDAASGEALPGVNIVLQGTNQGTTTDANGAYALSLKAGSYQLSFRYLGYATQIQQVTAVEGQPLTLDVALSPSDYTMNEIVVTGSRAGGRSQIESPVPVDVIKLDQTLINAPQLDLNQLLTYLAPSFQANRQSASDETEHIDPASLRGMGPDQVLVLVNGKRRHTSSLVNTSGTFGRGTVGTDLSTIPAAAIDRIEILRDGAAAQYGSDAIAGVINIVLKSDTDAFTGIVSGGTHQAGDGETMQMSLNYGFKAGKSGFVNVTGQFSDRAMTNRATGDHTLNVYIPGFAYFGDTDVEAADNAEIRRRGFTRDDFKFRVGEAAMRSASVFFNASLPLDEQGTEFYTFGGLSQKLGVGSPFRRLPQESQNVPAIYPNGFQPDTRSDILDRSLSAGVRGRVNGWLLDFNNTFGSNEFNFDITNTVNTTLGAASPTSFYTGGFYFSQNVSGISASKFFNEMLAGINVAAGAEYRIDRYQLNPGDEASWRNYGIVDTVINGRVQQVDVLGLPSGSRGFVGFRPSDAVTANRTNAAAYADVEVNFTKNFLVTGALRFEGYSDFGNTLNGKLATRYLLGKVTLRGAYSTGFRAPSLQQIHFNKVSTDLDNGQLIEIGTFDNGSRAAQILGIPKLKQETSQSLSLGFTVQALPNLSLTADFYQIDVDDRIILTSEFTLDQLDDDIADELSQAGIQAANFFTNAIDTRTRGADIVLTYQEKLGKGRLDVTVAANYNRLEIVGAVKTSSELADLADSYLQPWDRLRIEQNNPRSKYTATATYGIGKFSAMLRGVRFGEVTLQPGEAFGARQTYSPQFVTDLSLTYQVAKGLSLTAGANNLFDQYPDIQLPDNSYLGVFRYPPIQQGMNGAYYFGRATFQF